jgi:NitT/TauT family transport system substrate-binding protein
MHASEQMAPAARRAAGLILLCVISMLLGACAKPPASLRLGYHEFPPYELLAMATEDGFFDHTRVHPVEYASATQGQRAFRNGAVDVAAVTLDEALTIAQDVPDLRVVAVLDRSHGGDAILARDGIGSLADLRGRRVGVELTALGAYMLTRALDHAGMTMNDVDIVHAQFDSHERLFQEGGVDAVVTFEPVRSRLIADGAKVLFDSASIPNEILDVLVTSASYADEHPEAIADLLKGWFRAVDELSRNPEQVSGRVASRLGMTAAEVTTAFRLIPLAGAEENRRYLLAPGATLPSQVKRLGTTMINASLLGKMIDPQQLTSVPAIHATLRQGTL